MQQQFAHLGVNFESVLGAQPVRVESLSGGCISAAYALHFHERCSVFAKHNPSVAADFFAAEAAGLQALAQCGQLRVPEVLHYSHEIIVLELVAIASPNENFWPTLGTGLAALHAKPAPCFGFDADNYCGSSPQLNPKTDCGYTFFAEQRLRYQARLAYDSGKLPNSDLCALEALLPRLPELIPSQPASLIHGDLWSGNVISDEHGDPVLIDPAAHWGWAEADIAMTLLFGGFATPFYEAYTDSRSLEPGWRERMPLYNLYHLLNHLNLFGTAYYHDVKQVIARFS